MKKNGVKEEILVNFTTSSIVSSTNSSTTTSLSSVEDFKKVEIPLTTFRITTLKRSSSSSSITRTTRMNRISSVAGESSSSDEDPLRSTAIEQTKGASSEENVSELSTSVAPVKDSPEKTLQDVGSNPTMFSNRNEDRMKLEDIQLERKRSYTLSPSPTKIPLTSYTSNSNLLGISSTKMDEITSFNMSYHLDSLAPVSRLSYPSKTMKDTEELLRSELAAVSVKSKRLEEDLRSTLGSLEQKRSEGEEQARQLDAHRQEHARQAATIISLRSRLQESEQAITSLQSSLHRAEISSATLSRENRRLSERITELEERVRTLLEERESAEQKVETSQRKLSELSTTVTSILNVPRNPGPHDFITDAISKKLSETIQELSALRSEKSQLEENLHQQMAAADGARQTISRLVTQLDEERRNLSQQITATENLRTSDDELRLKVRTAEEEILSLREKVQSTSKKLNLTLDELHATEAKFQQTKDELMVADHRRQQNEVEWKGVLNTLSSLLSAEAPPGSDSPAVTPTPQGIVQALQTRVANAREMQELIDRLKHQYRNVEDQVSVQSELYDAATKRAQKAEEDARSHSTRLRTLEAELNNVEQERESSVTEKDKNGRLLKKLIAALGLQDLGNEVSNDPDLVICRAEQLAKLEGDKLVDKTTTVYQLQRKLKSLRESVDRKDLHLDMLRRKLSLNEETTKAAKHVEDERDDLMARYRKQTRALERATGEAGELRLQLRDLRAQLAAAGDYKSRAAVLEERNEEMTAKIGELEGAKTRQQRKITQLKEQLRVANEQVIEERRVSDATLDGISHEMAMARQGIRDATRKERQLQDFRRVVMDLLGTDTDECNGSDFDTLGKLQRLISGQREMAQLTRRLDDVTIGSSRPCSAHTFQSRSSSGRSFSPQRPASSSQIMMENRSPQIDSGLADINAELRAMTEHAHNHRPNVRVLHSSPTRSRSPNSDTANQSPSKTKSRNDNKFNFGPQIQGIGRPSSHQHGEMEVSASRSPSPTHQNGSYIRQFPSPTHGTPSPSPILQRPGSASKKFGIGRVNSVSFLEQDEDETTEDDELGNGVKSC